MDSFGKPSELEDSYFAQREYKRRKEAAEAEQAKLKEAERAKARELHHMKCPKCGMDLVEVEYKQIKIDKCTACEGIWFDAGELETLLQQEAGPLHKILKVFR